MTFIDTMRPITPAETKAGRFFLSLHSIHWRAACHMFRRPCQGEEPEAHLLQFGGACLLPKRLHLPC